MDWRVIARQVLRSRLLDELEESELAPSGEVPYQFSARGHELAQVLLAREMTHPRDAAGVYYRSRPFMLSVGLTLEEALRAGMGRASSPSEGRDVGVVFSMPPRSGPTVLPASGDVGAQFTPVAGWAQSIDYHRRVREDDEWQGAMAVALGGDGSVASNGFWSALTIATTLKLPMLFFIEDNNYGISVPSELQTPGGNIAANMDSFANLTVLDGSGTDPRESASLTRKAVGTVRSGGGPCLLRLTVPRLSGHTFIDNQSYKSEDELERERARDPIRALEALLGKGDLERLRSEVSEEVQEALERARSTPPPERGTATRFLFFDGQQASVGGLPELRLQSDEQVSLAPNTRGPRLNFIDAVRMVMEQELESNPRAVIFGEDVGVKGGVHGATADLQAKFGVQRVFDTSLSEEGILGRAVGMALAGLLPIPEIQFRKYADPATEQINDAGTLRWRTAGKFAAPMVVRIPVGYSKKIGDPWHSVTGEAIFAHTPGWRLAFPSNAADAVGLFRSALRGRDPTMFFEHRALLDSPAGRRPYPGDEYVIPFGVARRISAGDMLTIVTWGAMVELAQKAAELFSGKVEILDLRTIVPWDEEAVLESVRKTGRCLVLHEDTRTAGFAGEILAVVGSRAFTFLDAPLQRLTAPDVPVPYSADLMDEVVPDVPRIRSAIEDLLNF